MNDTINLLDIVALSAPLSTKGLVRGQVGTVVEMLDPQHVEVEFADERGVTYATAAVKTSDLIVLHYQPVSATS